jgi:ribosomal silencing factor RsfS
MEHHADDHHCRVAVAVAMAEVADLTKAADVQVLHVAPFVYWTRVMVLVTAFSRPQVNAIG